MGEVAWLSLSCLWWRKDCDSCPNSEGQCGARRMRESEKLGNESALGSKHKESGTRRGSQWQLELSIWSWGDETGREEVGRRRGEGRKTRKQECGAKARASIPRSMLARPGFKDRLLGIRSEAPQLDIPWLPVRDGQDGSRARPTPDTSPELHMEDLKGN